MDIYDIIPYLLGFAVFTFICFLWFVLIVSILELIGWIII